MKKFLVAILVMLIPIIAIAQEPAQIPTISICNMLTGNQQENDFCDAWKDVLIASDVIIPASGEESYIFYVIMVSHDEPSGITSVSFTQLWKVPAIGGITMIVWQALLVDEHDAIVSAQAAKFEESLGVFYEWVQDASKIFSNICPPCDGERKRVPVTASVTN